jgi:hypothetical protein
VLAREAGAHVAELGQDLGGAHPASAGEGHHDPAIGQLGDQVLDPAGEFGQLGDQRLQGTRQRAHQLAFGVGLGLTGAAISSTAQAFEQRVGGAPPAVAMLGEEAGEALGPEAGGRFGRGIALEEGERDRTGEIAEDPRGAGPEALEHAAQLVGQRDARPNEVVAAAHQGAQRLDRVGLGRERAQAVAIGAQDVGQDEGVARVALGGDRTVARPAGLEQVGMDRDDAKAGVHQRVDQEAGGSLDRDRDRGRRPVLLQARAEGGEAGAIVADGKLVQDLSPGIDHAHRVRRAAPVDADHHRHGLVSSSWVIIPIAGSPGGVLIHRRSGWQPTAHLPVARHGLPATVAPLVSSGPSQGQRRWRSRRRHGTNAPPAYRPNQRQVEVAE